MGEEEPLIKVRRQWNDWKIAVYKLSSISGFHWSDESGGVNAPAPQLFLHGYVMCDGMESGELSHSCRHGPPPHRIKVCITNKYNEGIFPKLSELYPKPAARP
jgi:hypothetical protein